jgi:hypothetical protein
LHDEKATLFSVQPLPVMNAFIRSRQAGATRPMIDLDHHVGWYAELGWAPPGPFELQYFHYDNRADPQSFDDGLQWGWRTRFDHVGAILDLDRRTRLTAQAIDGTTLMGFHKNGARWVDMHFQSAFLLATRQVAIGTRAGSVSARIEAFGTHNRGSVVLSDDDESGWAATAATRWPLLPYASLFAEALHIDSRRDARLREHVPARQQQNIIRLTLRLRGVVGS